AQLEWRRRRAREQPVAIATRAGGVAGVEARRRLAGREHGDLVREALGEGRRGALRRRAALDVDRGDLAERVDAGVRAACDREVLHRREGLAKRLPERRL